MKLRRIGCNKIISRAAFAHLLRFNAVNTVREYKVMRIVTNSIEVDLKILFGFQLIHDPLEARHRHLAANISRQCGLDFRLDLGVVQRTETRGLKQVQMPANDRHWDQFFDILRKRILVIQQTGRSRD